MNATIDRPTCVDLRFQHVSLIQFPSATQTSRLFYFFCLIGAQLIEVYNPNYLDALAVLLLSFAPTGSICTMMSRRRLMLRNINLKRKLARVIAQMSEASAMFVLHSRALRSTTRSTNSEGQAMRLADMEQRLAVKYLEVQSLRSQMLAHKELVQKNLAF